jgi:hypothetical protein
MPNTVQYFCTRPQLAEKLIRRGFKPEYTVNPWSPDRAAWRFDITPELATFVESFYREIGKPLPGSTERAFAAAGVIQ